ncbi:MAG: peptidoglycan-associated lipoprotein Pal [Alphaproteobacteria bacterium]|nr:peptidoglycan-associated lipoprotein Pal [Alphaproteobacteria bacterium]
MRLKIIALCFAGFALVACESTPENAGSASGTGAGMAGSGGGGSGAGVSSQPLSGPRPGTQEDLTVNVGDRVFFDLDRFDLRADARAILDRQAAWLRTYPNVALVIEGHADERGTREYNLALAERRANSVRSYLTALGVSPSRVSIVSFGKERPVDPRSNEDAWSQNRRAVSVVDTRTGGGARLN